MKLVLTMVLLGVMCGCATSRPHTTAWSQDQIVGHTFDLVGTDFVESFAFIVDGSATAVVGNERMLAGPVYRWHLSRSGVLILKRDGVRSVKLQKLMARDNQVQVLRNGKLATYTVNKTNRPQQHTGHDR